MIVADLPFASVAQLAAFRGSSKAADAMVLDQVSAMIRTYCGWHIWPSRAETVTLDGSGASVQLLPTKHLTAVTAVTVGGVEVAGTDYTWTQAGALAYLTGYWWPAVARTVVASITHGYPEPLPDLAAVAIGLAARQLASPTGATRTQVGQVSVAHGDPGMSQAERWVLDRYALPKRP